MENPFAPTPIKPEKFYEPEASWGASWSALQTVSKGYTAGRALSNLKEFGDLNNKPGKQYTSEEQLNEWGTDFGRSVNLESGDYLFKQRQEYEEAREVLSFNRNTFFKGKLLPVVSGLAATATDPLEVGVMVGTGLLTGGISVAAGVSSIVGRTAIQSVVGTASFLLSETAAVTPSVHLRGEEYGAADVVIGALASVVIGDLAMPGVVAAYKGVAKHLQIKAMARELDISKSNVKQLLKADLSLDEMRVVTAKNWTLDANEQAIITRSLGDVSAESMGDLQLKISKGLESGEFTPSQVAKLKDDLVNTGTSNEKFSSLTKEVAEIDADVQAKMMDASKDVKNKEYYSEELKDAMESPEINTVQHTEKMLQRNVDLETHLKARSPELKTEVGIASGTRKTEQSKSKIYQEFVDKCMGGLV